MCPLQITEISLFNFWSVASSAWIVSKPFKTLFKGEKITVTLIPSPCLKGISTNIP